VTARDNRGHGPLLPPKPQPGHGALRRGRISIPNQIYNVTATTQGRAPIFRDFAAACAAARCFEEPVLLRDAKILAWVLMPDHAHWLIQLGKTSPLPEVVNRLKSASARHANRTLGRTGPLWAPAYHDHALRHEEDVQAAARYIVANPLRIGLVQDIGAYPFWNAIWL